jgi:hypothetical protein
VFFIKPHQQAERAMSISFRVRRSKDKVILINVFLLLLRFAGTHPNAANGTVANSVANSADEQSFERASTSPTGDALNVSHHSIESSKSVGSVKSAGSAISSGGRRTDISDGGSVSSGGGGMGHSRKNSKALGSLGHSSSIIGLDSMIENRREEGGLTSNVVHMEVPFGKPIEEVYDGIHSGPVLGSGISGLVRLVTHKATGVKYAVKCLDLSLVDTDCGLQQLREEIFIMCQLDHPNVSHRPNSVSSVHLL